MGEDAFKFELFTKLGARLKNYTISLGRHGGFGFNSSFYNKEGIKNYSHVLLSFDKNSKAVGFQFTSNSKTLGAFTITHGNNSGSVVAHSFLASCDINPEDYLGKYAPEKYNDKKLGELFYIVLKKVSEKTTNQ